MALHDIQAVRLHRVFARRGESAGLVGGAMSDIVVLFILSAVSIVVAAVLAARHNSLW